MQRLIANLVPIIEFEAEARKLGLVKSRFLGIAEESFEYGDIHITVKKIKQFYLLPPVYIERVDPHKDGTVLTVEQLPAGPIRALFTPWYPDKQFTGIVEDMLGECCSGKCDGCCAIKVCHYLGYEINNANRVHTHKAPIEIVLDKDAELEVAI